MISFAAPAQTRLCLDASTNPSTEPATYDRQVHDVFQAGYYNLELRHRVPGSEMQAVDVLNGRGATGIRDSWTPLSRCGLTVEDWLHHDCDGKVQ